LSKGSSDVDRRTVDDYLKRHNGSYARIQQIEDEAVTRLFPKHRFFAVIYPRYPVARRVPAELKASNVLAVGQGGKIRLLNEADALQDFFKSDVAAVQDDERAKTVAHAWLRLSQEFVQDGFYQFEILDDSIRVQPGKDGRAVRARAVVMRGGNGDIRVALTFDADGHIAQVSEKADVRPGPRPICQATKLTDSDGIVRRMAEQDLLIMGRAAQDYLAEQRRTADPKLQQAIDRIWQRIVKEEH
jgi:hypothetical protein